VTVDTGDDVAGLSRAGAAAAETLSFVSELVRPECPPVTVGDEPLGSQ
jgi:hypothetical protein